ncbi:MAG: hypothetical protein AVDCRST_MAG26-946 [uncultured Chloroflexia bacterium]|uniref:Uncharacterized protein n=1 Tax=uncultured Chloroflexia bacterium TaxID=1672391 RepID=A0A6J4HQC7_9CHLR|nr:MAG: hypothetical protein AVDCRST_MAG26-946 [uncultured Chloroflexia bacterium]
MDYDALDDYCKQRGELWTNIRRRRLRPPSPRVFNPVGMCKTSKEYCR